ncbi:iron-containing alcohol dehydrogenase [Fredinandcohnia onubensis]|uniref:iron-containing alcohol dehydrogenase n=1 Tax=Fredinandcohnia onubensis TaxID=1571209 RepID=UPI000C0BD67E|nr:iron-containing alcohol dehydrogenase [Fredinandcohnia onubensis]
MTMYHDFKMPENVRFGVGAHKSLPDEVRRIGARKIGLISDKGLEKAGVVDKIKNLLESLAVPIATFTDIQGEPSFSLLRNTIDHLKQEECDLIIGIGGGSAMDVAKTTAALIPIEVDTDYISGTKVIETRGIPCILLPTTSGTGAEVTMNAIFADEEREVKRGLVSPALLPTLAIVDPSLTLSCPPKVTAASGVDAFTHAIESYIAVKATPLTKIYAEKAMKLFPNYITKAVHHGNDLEARIGMSWVSHLAGVSLANAGVGAVHALSYPLGGKYHIEHGVANALLMPYVFDVIGKTCMAEMVDIATLIGIGDYSNRPFEAQGAVVNYLYHLLHDLDLPISLQELGIKEQDLPQLAVEASKIDRLLLNTPNKLTEQKILNIYQKAFNGKI